MAQLGPLRIQFLYREHICVFLSGSGGRELGTGIHFQLFVFYFFSALATSYGYLVNDLGDRELDRRHNKPNVFEKDSAFCAITVVGLFLLGAVLLSLYFRKNHPFVALWLLWILIATFYSLPPFRLKEKGKIGLLLIVTAQRLIPALLIFSVFGKMASADAVIIILYIMNRGFISDLRHQLEDLEHDLSTGTRTFAAENREQAGIFFKCLLKIDLLLQGMVHLACLFTMPRISMHGFSIPVTLPVFLVFVLGVVVLFLKHGTGSNGDPYYDTGLRNFLHLGIPSFYFPLYLLIVLVLYSPLMLTVLVFFLLLHRIFSPDRIRRSLPARIITALCRR